ncbi:MULTISPECIES: 3'-5' exoribonuclease YhaM [Priestia]|jgi:3'-5' exoribonuclease|uniref:3'-5' exoribonuclease YhaM n=10 Tax=Priestia TaxID=2800373 RepID=D5DYZ2_PRIM1|nr:MULTISPECIES: 3'-5' exoribonuclease YhaM [Priestia]AVX06742.1 3'-5' exoribonuclease YhaM [Bacillus sp. Y-01]KOP72946.1 3'-5' exonuclease [Bacillus sp. FJAT-21351]KQU24887.1 3'-5' exonuclease [Bacillus sp. Leaf75]KRD82106.1 3'-5' exonuclease [Bacillus sp. Root147]KRF52369.1 3'-5' exonuclease [Bacillus sp. Soil531]MBK0009513.1 3'-5' exoribonuclease YhaM [Bacillus sp. S35]MBK0295140.1 3'-5' exoribonuclease YhaM [Bacillus sp. S34]MBU8855006.1 3'-5' exoribonuclease YhaM [Bacillus sp. FJAT-263
MTKGIAQYEVGEQVDLYFLIKSSTRGIASNGKPFLTVILQDKTGDIEAKLWDASPDDEENYAAQKIVRAAGEVMNYRGRNQLKIRNIRPAQPQDGVRTSDFLEVAPLSQEEMVEHITKSIFEMKNSNVQRITRHLFKKYQTEFLEYPAATKNHHEFVSGLAYHVVSMLKLAESFSTLYPSLNRDLLYAGVILHDLGKVFELSGPVSTIYTVEGNLLGHISIMVNEIGKAAEELAIEGEEVMLLQHLVLSHHGKEEWGSPKKPLIKEAEMLHLIDNVDAKMNMLDRALTKVKPGEFTERIFALDNRSFYKPTID